MLSRDRDRDWPDVEEQKAMNIDLMQRIVQAQGSGDHSGFVPVNQEGECGLGKTQAKYCPYWLAKERAQDGDMSMHNRLNGC